MDTARVRTLEQLEEFLSNDLLKYEFYYVLDDKIIQYINDKIIHS